MSVGDVDGDGEYEFFVKWDPSNSQDVSIKGYTGKCFIDCYKLSGRLLWRLDMGVNIRAGAHYTQFMVYDFDGDGKAEMSVKTAPGTCMTTYREVWKVCGILLCHRRMCRRVLPTRTIMCAVPRTIMSTLWRCSSSGIPIRRWQAEGGQLLWRNASI